jgi:hypothetical protein
MPRPDRPPHDRAREDGEQDRQRPPLAADLLAKLGALLAQRKMGA